MTLSKAERTKRTTTLPASLLEQIGTSTGKKHGKGSNSRKQTRKLERSSKKERKASHLISQQKRGPISEHHESPPRKKVKLTEPKTSAMPQPAKPKKEPTSRKQKVALQEPPPLPQELNDNAYIDYLEGKLGYNKKRSKANDGLDDLLDFAQSIESSTISRNNLASGMSDDTEGESEDQYEDVSDGDSGEEEEWGGIGSSEDEAEQEEEEESSTFAESHPDPTAQVSKYVPPHVRQAQSNSEIDVRLVRQLKGLLNRLSEQNIASIVDGIEDIYQNHRRADTTSALSSLIVEGIASHGLLLDSYVVLHAALVSSLHKIIGIEFAAYFVQTMVSSYEKHLASTISSSAQDGDQEGGKESSNLIVLLSELYNFQVVSCVLVFDIIRSLLENDINELNVELLLKLLRSSGVQLRQDDPSALKDIVNIVQEKLSGKEDTITSRTSFMLETLSNLKNNKLKQRPAATHQGGDSVATMKKFLSSLGKRKHILAQEPLRFTLADLHSADAKGKWWLVGAAWGGDPLVDQDRRDAGKANQPTNPPDNMLLKLAKKHGMNSDIRRSIFVLIMSSDDYVNACERLLELKLSEVQQREIIRVLLHCCGNEKTYNPYYALIASHLCNQAHSYKVTLQYALWDFLRDAGDSSIGGTQVVKQQQEDTAPTFGRSTKTSGVRLINVAKTFAWLVAKGSLTLLVLKPIDFTHLRPTTEEFLQIFLTNIFVFTQGSSPTTTLATLESQITAEGKKNRSAIEEVFLKGAKHDTLAMGLVYYLGQTFKITDERCGFVSWAVSIGKDTLRTGIEVVSHL